jgi:glycosyltransferase involved in cell wall biosynthesis
MISKEGPLFDDVGVLALVPNRWGSTWQVRQHVLIRLARYFHVLWMDPAHEWQDSFAVMKRREPPSADRYPGLNVYVPEFWLPAFYRPDWLASFAFRQRVNNAARRLRRSGCKKLILYLWRPEFAGALDMMPWDVSCYHIDDEYMFGMETAPTTESEKRLLTTVDQVIVHSAGLMEKKGQLNPNTALITNGVDFSVYSRPAQEPEDLSCVPHPRIGYTGVIKKHLDWPLLCQLAESHPEWSFVFVGPIAAHAEITDSVDRLRRRPNVWFLGAKSWRQLAAYPQHFDVCIMPYSKADPSADYIFPVKLHEYLASGRPVVGMPIRSLENFTDVVSLATTLKEWETAIENGLHSAAASAEKQLARQSVAKRYDWGILAGHIAEILADRLGETYAGRLRKHSHNADNDREMVADWS